MTDHRKWGMTGTGLGFVALFVSGFLLLGELFGGFADPDAFFVAYYATDTHHIRDLAGGYLLVAAGLVLLLFFQQLLRHLRSLGGSPVPLDMAQASGTVGVTLLLAGVAAVTTVTFAKAFGRVTGDEPLTSPAVALSPQLGYVLVFLTAMWALALTIGLIAWASWRARIWPRWLCWLSVAATGLLPLSIGFMPIALLPVWVVGTSIWAWRSAPPNQFPVHRRRAD